MKELAQTLGARSEDPRRPSKATIASSKSKIPIESSRNFKLTSQRRWAFEEIRSGSCGSTMDSTSASSSMGREFVAGALGGMAGVISGHPLDTIRIRQQQPRHVLSSSPASAVGLLRHIVRTEGGLALYKGMSSPLATVAFQNAVAFQTYASLSKALLLDRNEPLPYERAALAGFGTGALQSLMLTPVELVKIRLQLQRTRKGCQVVENKGPLVVARNIVDKEGVRGLYRGLTVTVLRDAPAHAVYFASYECAREMLHAGCRKNGGESLFTMVTAGGFAGALSWMICYPLDVIKTRLQSHSDSRYRGIWDCLTTSIREEGKSVLWRGLGTALARAYVVNGAIFSAYEMSLRFLASRSSRDSIILNNAIKSEEAFLKGAEEATLP